MISLRAVSGFAIVAAFLTLAAAQEKKDQKPIRNPLARDPAAIEAGGKLFQGRCSFCHGTDAKGTGRGSDLTSGQWAHGGKDSELFNTIRKGVAGTEMPPNQLQDEQIWQLVSFIRSLGGAGNQPPVPGNPERGEELFFGKARCATCHMIRGRGSPFAPELSNIGADLSAAKIRQALVEPGAEIRRGSIGARIGLRAGEKFDAMVRNEDSFSIQLVDREGRLRLLDKGRIARLERLEKESLMPAAITRSLTPDELQDLLAFLDRQRARASELEDETYRP